MEEAMFGKRCSLCGGKLNSNGICTECGLDNNKSDKNYRINQSECDHEPLTHVHHGKNEKPEKQPKPNTPRQSWQGSTTTYSGNTGSTGSTGRKKSGKKKKPGRIISKIIAVIVIFNVFFGIFQPLVSDILDDAISGYQENTQDYTRSDPYEYVTKELPEDGESVSFELTSGDYVVGVHIPEGNYQADVSYDYDTVQVDDGDSGLYLYEYAGRTDGDYLDDLRLYNGAIVHISSQTTITLYSDNAQTDNVFYEDNPLAGQKPVTIKEDAIVGPDLPAGVYDLTLVSGEGSVDVDIYAEYGESMETKNLYLGENCTDGKEYKNLVLPKNAQITLDDNMELRLTPSEKVSTTDYYQYYNY
ncbi:hypothetical protein DXD10_10965 [Dorea formicigenerans]|uniref:Uncharacterized protein n=2 Tax=Dorea formicigenerans TaxID=39486 RepID=A0A3E4MAU4_9FIRM|nr:hypothetical protein DXD10_10965 [Dorea formicigenerans]